MRLNSIRSPALPCVFLRFSRRLGRLLPLRPAVSCARECSSCAWDRREQRRRLTEGRWLRGADGLLRLHFPAAGEDSGHIAREKEESK